MTTHPTDEMTKAFERDKTAYKEQWSDSTMPITRDEACAYKAGWEDGWKSREESKK